MDAAGRLGIEARSDYKMKHDNSTYNDQYPDGSPIHRTVIYELATLPESGSAKAGKCFVSWRTPDGHRVFTGVRQYNDWFPVTWEEAKRRNERNSQVREKMGLE